MARNSRSVRRKKKWLWVVLILATILVLAILALGYHLLAFPPSSRTVTYVTKSAPTSQWLILSFSQPPQGVTANNTGPIPEFYSSESLNATRIGVYCTQTVTSEASPGSGGNSTLGTCAQFTTYQQTGWYWDQKSGLLTIHYLGGPDVRISIAT